MAGPRQAPPIPLEFAEGLYTNDTDRGAKGRWIDGDNVRWSDGLPEKIGGYELSLLTDADGVTTVTYMGKVRSTWEWDSLDGETWIAFGTACKLYLINRGVLYDITPMRAQYTAVNAFSAVHFFPTVTVNIPGHDAQEGDHFRIQSVVNVGGLTLPIGEYEVTSVVDLDHFTITMGSNATSTATSVGTVTVQFDISCGLESDSALYGYGVGAYGSGTYGTARGSSDFIGKMRTWSLDNWGEDLLASPSGGTLYEWKRTNGPDSRSTQVIGAPANIERMIVGPDDRHVIALGSNLESTGVHDKMFTRWCAGDDYTVWNKLSTNDAGSKRLDSGSRLITGVKTRNGILNFTDKAIYFTSLLGGTDVYSIAPLGYSPEIISPEAGIDIDGTVYFMCVSDFYKWSGQIEVMECDIYTKVFGTKDEPGLNRDMMNKVHVRVIHEFNEIWWSYPSFGSVENDSVAIYNYKSKCWYYSSIPREAGRSSSPSLDRQPYAFYNGNFWLHEAGVDGATSDGTPAPMYSFIKSSQREALDGALEVRISKMIPDMDAIQETFQITIQGRERPQADEVTDGPYDVAFDTEVICPDLRVRQVGILVESEVLGGFFRMGTWTAYGTIVSRKSA